MFSESSGSSATGGSRGRCDLESLHGFSLSTRGSLGGMVSPAGAKNLCHQEMYSYKKITKPEKMGEPLVILLVNGGMIVCSELGNITEVYFSC